MPSAIRLAASQIVIDGSDGQIARDSATPNNGATEK